MCEELKIWVVTSRNEKRREGVKTIHHHHYHFLSFPPLFISSDHHHHHVAPPAQIFLTVTRNPFLSSIAPGRFSRLHPVSAQRCCLQVPAGRPAFVRPCEGFHSSMSLMSSFPLLQQCPACLVRLTWIVFMMGGWWPYKSCFFHTFSKG